MEDRIVHNLYAKTKIDITELISYKQGNERYIYIINSFSHSQIYNPKH